MTPIELKQRAAANGPERVIAELLESKIVTACQTEADYMQFRLHAMRIYASATMVFIAGSGNWGFSLDPKNLGRPFHKGSDIDLGIVDEKHFRTTWDELRKYQRAQYYQLTESERSHLQICGKSIYCGYASPAWIPDKANKYRWEHVRAMNDLCSVLVGFKKVNLMFFKDRVESTDYYKRGLMALMREANI